MAHPVTQYAINVVFGQLGKMCCIDEILSCKRHLADLEKSKTSDYPYMFDEDRADRIIKYFAIARQVSGAFEGQPFDLLDWQQFDFGCIYGWVKKGSGKRRFTTAYISEGRGQAKSACLSVCGCYAMTSDCYWIPGHPEAAIYPMNPEVLCAAVDAGQAGIVRDGIKLIAEASPDIAKQLILRELSIKHKTRGGHVLKLSKDTKNKDGYKPSFIIIDEYHAHPNAKVRETASKGKGKTAQSLEIIITTAGDDAQNKPCYKEDQFCEKILRGEIKQENFFVMIRRIDDDDNPHDKSCWCKPNPMIRTMTEYSETLYEEIETNYSIAYNSGDADKIRDFLIKRMNTWQADSANKYMTGCMDKWKNGAVSKEEFAKVTDNKPVDIGFDLGKTLDLSGTGAVFHLPDERWTDGLWCFKIGAFMPQNRAVEHEHSDRIPYLEYAKQGYCTLTPGSVTDSMYVDGWILENEKDHGWKTEAVSYDGHNATDCAGRLQDYYNDPDKVIEIYQTCGALNEGTKKFREIVLQGNFIYEENPLFDWCLGNAIEVKNNFGDIKLSKKHKDDTQRIDPVAALMNAMARAVKHEPPKVDINEKILSEGWSL